MKNDIKFYVKEWALVANFLNATQEIYEKHHESVDFSSFIKIASNSPFVSDITDESNTFIELSFLRYIFKLNEIL